MGKHALRRTPRPETRAMMDRIKELRLQGYSNDEIHTATGIAKSYVSAIASDLITLGEIPRRSGRRQAS